MMYTPGSWGKPATLVRSLSLSNTCDSFITADKQYQEMKRYVTIPLLIIPFFLLPPVWLAAQNRIEVGGTSGWGGLAAFDGVEIVPRGQRAMLLLQESRISPDADTQLLLQFDSLPTVDRA